LPIVEKWVKSKSSKDLSDLFHEMYHWFFKEVWYRRLRWMNFWVMNNMQLKV
jgi:hypothetical protein